MLDSVNHTWKLFIVFNEILFENAFQLIFCPVRIKSTKFCLLYALNLLIFADDFIQTCQIKDPDFEDCSTQSIQKLFTKLVKGIYS